MANQLDGKVAIVTGAAAPTGIGAAYAKALAREGASVVIADIDKRVFENAEAWKAEGLEISACEVDVTSLESAEAMVDFAKSTYGGRVDIAVNNAAIMAAIPHGGFFELPLEWYDRVMAINARGVLVCCKAVIPTMKEQGGGKIINQSSTAAWLPGTVYRLSKLAVAAITAGLAQEVGLDNIQVNAIAPGMIHSEGGFGVTAPENRAAKYKMFPHPRPDRDPEDLCGLLILLATDAGDYIHGQTINIDGGMVMRL